MFGRDSAGPECIAHLHTLLLLHLYTCISLSKSTSSVSSSLSRLNTFTELMRQLRPQSRCETTVIRLALVRSTTIFRPLYDHYMIYVRSTTIHRPFYDHFLTILRPWMLQSFCDHSATIF